MSTPLHFLTKCISRLLALVLVSWAFARVGVHSLFLLPSISRCFSIHSSSPAIEFHSRFFVTTDVSATIVRPFTYSLFEVSLQAGERLLLWSQRRSRATHEAQAKLYNYIYKYIYIYINPIFFNVS